jgi:hypothetical protein
MASFCKSVYLSDSESEELLGFSSELSVSDCNILDSVSSGDSECNFSREVPPRKNFQSVPLFGWRYTDFRPTVHEFKSDVSGISVNIEKDSSVSDFLQLYSVIVSDME